MLFRSMKEGHYHTENAYEPVEAEYFTYNNNGEMAWGTERSDYKNQDVVYSSRRGYLGYHYIDFGDYAPESMTLSYSSTSLAQFKVNLNIRRDSSDGEIIGTAALGRSTSKTQETVALDKTKIADMKGIQKVYLEVESLRGDFKMDWFRFAADPLAVSAPERNKNRVWVYDGVLYMQGENVGNYNIYDVFGKLRSESVV